jgi:hypothetical protein
MEFVWRMALEDFSPPLWMWWPIQCGKPDRESVLKEIQATRGMEVIAGRILGQYKVWTPLRKEYSDQDSKSYIHFGISSTGVRILRGGRLQKFMEEDHHFSI